MIVLGYVLEWALRRELGENAKVEALEARRLMLMLLFDLYENQKEKRILCQLYLSLLLPHAFDIGRKEEEKRSSAASSHLYQSQ